MVTNVLDQHPLLTFFKFKSYGDPYADRICQRYISEEKCTACGSKCIEKSPENIKIQVAGEGEFWPDILGGVEGDVLHERVVEAIQRANLTGLIAHPVTIEIIRNDTLKKLAPPQYYFPEVTGSIDIDQNELDDEGGSVCPICFNRISQRGNKYRWAPKRLIPQMETWDGSDFVKIRNLRSEQKFCTKEFVDLASHNNWTNFIFGEDLPNIVLWAKPPKGGLSYYSSDWFEEISQRVEIKHPDSFE